MWVGVGEYSCNGSLIWNTILKLVLQKIFYYKLDPVVIRFLATVFILSTVCPIGVTPCIIAIFKALKAEKKRSDIWILLFGP